MCGNVTIELDLAQGERVQVHVETEFAEATALATGSVTLDGEKIFDQRWSFPDGI